MTASKTFLEISQKSRKNICVGVSFLMKIQAGGMQLYYRDPGIGDFCKFCKIFKNSERLLLKSKIFADLSDFYYVDNRYYVNNCFSYISSNFLEA